MNDKVLQSSPSITKCVLKTSDPFFELNELRKLISSKMDSSKLCDMYIGPLSVSKRQDVPPTYKQRKWIDKNAAVFVIRKGRLQS